MWRFWLLYTKIQVFVTFLKISIELIQITVASKISLVENKEDQNLAYICALHLWQNKSLHQPLVIITSYEHYEHMILYY